MEQARTKPPEDVGEGGGQRADYVGKVNNYRCRSCGGIIITKDVDHGVTPFMTMCRASEGCRGMMVSSFYKVTQQTTVTHVWYKPRSIDDVPSTYREHVERGGLLLIPAAEYRREMSAPNEVPA